MGEGPEETNSRARLNWALRPMRLASMKVGQRASCTARSLGLTSLGVLEGVAVADDVVRIGRELHPEEVATAAVLCEGLPQGESIDDVDCPWGELETLTDDGRKTLDQAVASVERGKIRRAALHNESEPIRAGGDPAGLLPRSLMMRA